MPVLRSKPVRIANRGGNTGTVVAATSCGPPTPSPLTSPTLPCPVCRVFRPLNELAASSLDAASTAATDSGDPSLRASGAFARWAAAVRMVSAARALQVGRAGWIPGSRW